MPAMAKKRKWVAILGGSFDPPHLGHILLSQWVLAGYPIDELWWMPSHTHPWQKSLSPIKLRQAMCRLAIKHLPPREVKVSDFEVRLSYAGRTPGAGRTLGDGKTLH